MGRLFEVAVALLLAGCVALIDRAAVVSRHTVRFSGPLNPSKSPYDVLTVGNGKFAFTADRTGLQSLNNSYHTPRYPLYTLSDWVSVQPGLSYPMGVASAAVEASFEDVTLVNGSAAGRRAASSIDSSRVALLQRAAKGPAGNRNWAYAVIAESTI